MLIIFVFFLNNNHIIPLMINTIKITTKIAQSIVRFVPELIKIRFVSISNFLYLVGIATPSSLLKRWSNIDGNLNEFSKVETNCKNKGSKSMLKNLIELNISIAFWNWNKNIMFRFRRITDPRNAPLAVAACWAVALTAAIFWRKIWLAKIWLFKGYKTELNFEVDNNELFLETM